MSGELVKISGRSDAPSIRLPGDRPIVVGRGEDADVQILDPDLSRQHCVFVPDVDTYIVRDMDSRNGTWVNDKRIEEVRLAPGDRVRLAGTEFEFHTGSRSLGAAAAKPIGIGEERKVSIDMSNLMARPREEETIEDLRRAKSSLATIYKVGNLINAEGDVRRLYARVTDAIAEVIAADRTYLMLVPEEGGYLEIVAHRQSDSAEEDPHTPFSHTSAEDCILQGSPILRVNAMEDTRFGQAHSVISQHIQSALCVPVESTNGILGVIYVDSVSLRSVFTEDDLDLLAAVGRQAGIAVERARLLEEVRAMLYRAVRALVASIEAKDEYTRGHSERVTEYALAVAGAMGISGDELQNLELASLLHDVGKIGVDIRILRKPGKLTDEEYCALQRHADMGGRIVAEVEKSSVLAKIVRHHHERWDGDGYPDGLKADESPKLALILSVADSFDAMTSKRPYRDPLSAEAVVNVLKDGTGTQWDPAVVPVFLGLLEEGKIQAEH